MGKRVETLRDFSWLKGMLSGKLVERFRIGPFRAVALDLAPREGGESSSFHFRILLFSESERQPVAAFNLESSILGSDCLTEQIGRLHQNLGHPEGEMSYERFKAWALKRIARFTLSIHSPAG